MRRAKASLSGVASIPAENVAGRKRCGSLTTGDMARLANSTMRTVRFYEEAGVLQPAQRSEGGHRLFENAELDKLLLVLDLRTAGLSLDEIKSLLALKSNASTGATASTRVGAALASQLTQMRARIAALTRLEREFSSSMDILTSCGGCHDNPRFPTSCGSCPVLVDKAPSPPRALRVLWHLAGEETEHELETCDPVCDGETAEARETGETGGTGGTGGVSAPSAPSAPRGSRPSQASPVTGVASASSRKVIGGGSTGTTP